MKIFILRAGSFSKYQTKTEYDQSEGKAETYL